MSLKLVITGATKGIGYALAQKFAAEKFDIAFCSRNVANVQALQEELITEHGIKAYGLLCDVSDKKELEKFADKALKLLGGCDVLVNNAGIFTPGNIENEASGLLEMQLNTNVISAYYLCRKLLPSLIKGNRSHIFNMCSVASIKAYPNGASYCISKHALLGFSRVLREEMKSKGVRVTAILPGATFTDSWAGTAHPENRFVQSSEIANIVWGIYENNSNMDVEEITLRPLLGDL